MAQINIVNMSRVINDSFTSRIESEYYLQEYALNKEALLAIPHTILRELLLQPVKTGHTPSMKNRTYYGNDVAFVKTDNLHDGIISDSFKDYLSFKGNALIAGSQLKQDDIITTIIGATFDVVPRSSLVLASILPANINQNIALIRVSPQRVMPEYVSAYLNTKFGKTYLRYLSRQTGQVNLNCREVEQVIVPLFSRGFQCRISNIVKRAYKCQNESKTLYDETEKFLLDALGMSGFMPSVSKFSVRGFAESFRTSNRIDAEYYQEKYDRLFRCLTALACDKLGNIVTIIKSIEPGSDCYHNDGVPFVRVSDISKFGIQAPDIHIPQGIAETAPRPKRNTILLSKDGSVGIAYKVEQDLDCVTSGAILHLTLKRKDILPDYLTIVLNSGVVQLQAERDAGGSVIQHWKPSEIAEVVIPILDDHRQAKIESDIQHSFSLRRRSERLLDCAIHAVEIAIEDGEDNAVAWLKGQKG